MKIPECVTWSSELVGGGSLPRFSEIGVRVVLGVVDYITVISLISDHLNLVERGDKTFRCADLST